jgi:hypothetical protein
MRTLLSLLIFFLGIQAQAAISSPVSFDGDVRAFDKTWVQLMVNKQHFRVHTKDWIRLNGPVRTGPQKVTLDNRTFNLMKGDHLLNFEK